MANTPRTYDIKEYAKKARAALLSMEQKQQPNKSEKGSKSEVIQAVKTDIKAMMDKGYTAQQIAEAFKNDDVFAILPKSITELVLAKKKNLVKKESKKSTEQVTEHGTGAPRKPANKSKNTVIDETKGAFAVKPDSEDI